MTPMLQRAEYHCASTVRKQYPGNSGGRTSTKAAALRQATLAQPWHIRLVTRQREAMHRQPLAVWLKARHGPVRHDRRPRGSAAVLCMIVREVRRVEKLSLRHRDDAMHNAGTNLGAALQRVSNGLQETIADRNGKRAGGIEHGSQFSIGEAKRA
jgi:hypothetical protein